jgi:hypothetical protein
MANTEYGSWNDADGLHLTVEGTVTCALKHWVDQYDVPEIAKRLRKAINKALPEGVSLCGDTFYGPYPKVEVDLKEAVNSVDFWGLVFPEKVSE